jgi:ATP-binding cassette subfamily F protein 3
VAPFSGGEKARLVLALLVYQKPNLLLLDEPTNHLDLEMRLALAEALQDFAGAMVIVSHDRHLLRVTCDQLLLVHGGGVREFDGALEDYPAWLAEQQRAADPMAEAAVEAASTATESAADRKARKREEAERRKQLQPLRNKVKKLEQRVDTLSAKQSELETALADPALYEADRKDRLRTLLEDKARIDAELAQVETDWMAAAEELEAADSP